MTILWILLAVTVVVIAIQYFVYSKNDKKPE